MREIIHGDCLEKLKELQDNSVDAVVTDPPYGLSFMGKKWDYDVPSTEIWQECLRVLKPGGYLLAFAGTRTQHRMAVRIEDAGFEIRDMIAWVYGSGFPKSLNIGKAVDKLQGNEREVVGTQLLGGNAAQSTKEKGGTYGSNTNAVGVKPIEVTLTKGNSPYEGWGTALKPALEPITVARKPLSEKTVAENVLKWGTGGINIDGSRVEYQGESDKASATPQGKCTSNNSAGSAPDVYMSEVDYHGEKYWYKNEYKWLIDKWLDDEDYVWSELKQNLESPETYSWCKLPQIDDGDRVLFDSAEGVCTRLYESKRKEFERPEQLGRFPANLIHDGSDEVVELFPNDSQRFFYCAKASKSERNKGCELLEEKQTVGGGGGIGNYLEDVNSASGKYGSEKAPNKNNHPTVKPIALMEYLVKLVTKENAVVLDPFAGSGSTLLACKNLKRDYIGIEKEEEYIKIIEARLSE